MYNSPPIKTSPPSFLPLTEFLTKKMSVITVQNVSKGRIFFKLRTKHPEHYLVRPKEGLLEKGQTVSIEIHLDKKVSPSPSVLSTDKFMLLAVPTNDKVYSPSVWTKLRPPDMYRKKLPISNSEILGSNSKSDHNEVESIYGSVRMEEGGLNQSVSEFSRKEAEVSPPKFSLSMNIPIFLDKQDAQADEIHTEFLRNRIAEQEKLISKMRNDNSEIKRSLDSLGYKSEKAGNKFSIFILLFLALLGFGFWLLRLNSEGNFDDPLHLP